MFRRFDAMFMMMIYWNIHVLYTCKNIYHSLLDKVMPDWTGRTTTPVSSSTPSRGLIPPCPPSKSSPASPLGRNLGTWRPVWRPSKWRSWCYSSQISTKHDKYVYMYSESNIKCMHCKYSVYFYDLWRYQNVVLF